MIEFRVGPLNRIVTLLAGSWKPLVWRAVRIVVIGLMARNTGRGCQVEVVIDVAIGTSARRNRMPSR